MKKRNVKKLRKIEMAARRSTDVRLIVFDLEATCWEPEEPDRVEILEIGAVRMPAGTDEVEHEAAREFSEIVRPVLAPALGEFCLGLIPIGQAEADASDPFPIVFARFLAWIGEGPFWLASWGSFDRAQLDIECKRHCLAMPRGFAGHIDLRREFARSRNVRPPGLKTALEAEGLTMDGVSHRALPDARNLARLARILVKPLELNRR